MVSPLLGADIPASIGRQLERLATLFPTITHQQRVQSDLTVIMFGWTGYQKGV